VSFTVQPVIAYTTITIKADGSIDPTTANITSTDNITYYFTDDNHGELIVQKVNSIIDGAGYTLHGGIAYSAGVRLANNATIQNMQITGFVWGIYLFGGKNRLVTKNNITNCSTGIHVEESTNNILSDNYISSNYVGYLLASSNDNIISNNYITDHQDGIELMGLTSPTQNVTISNNTITGNFNGITLWWCDSNSIYGNNITNNDKGIKNRISSNNIVYHNYFMNNSNHVFIQYSGFSNIWDDGYPSGGNYWSGFETTDIYGGSYQNQSGSDGIGDTPYVADATNVDNYPLGPFPEHDVAVISLEPVKNIVGQGFYVSINVTSENQGDVAETFNVILYANSSIIAQSGNITLNSADSQSCILTWNTTKFAFGEYLINASILPMQYELETIDNVLEYYSIVITISGDVDADFDVDIFDIVKIAVCYGSEEGESRYISNSDIDGDGDIDLFDFVPAEGNYGIDL